MRFWTFVLAACATFAAWSWANDIITLQGERTVYTVECRDQMWHGRRCDGHLVAGDRFRFRALKPHHEVIFWTVGRTEPSGKFTDCVIESGRNWTCKPNAQTPFTITLQMVHGTPVPDASGHARAFHAVAKWRWWLLRAGIPTGSTADT